MDGVVKKALNAAVEAGKAIMDIYRNGDFNVEVKSDNSPLTKADKAAHKIICTHLSETGIPILSEEGKQLDYEERKSWKRLWIVDPLDGTKEFIKKTGEFTVNIALIENEYPVAGVVFVPATGTLYFANVKDGAFKIELGTNLEKEGVINIDNRQKLPLKERDEKLQIVASVSHLSEETKLFAKLLNDKFKETEFVLVGSSIKICKVAEGVADIYPRLGPTMEWDTAAGQAIAEAAGAKFIDWKSGERCSYNRPDLLNGWFVVAGDKFQEKELLDLMQESGL